MCIDVSKMWPEVTLLKKVYRRTNILALVAPTRGVDAFKKKWHSISTR